ncbi:Rhodopsin domain-containing protein [Madurella fahalii]|uniref:Rhodopsin domain-containing protein n=1 Tax=Madurella fahalii TaxID=1157608 RepID=A0ABQ0GNR8_9PEZI
MDAFTREAFSLLAAGLLVIGLRMYVRISTSGFKHLHPDDYLMVLAAVVYAIETYLAYSVGAFWKGLANNGMTDEHRRLLDTNSEEYRLRVNGSKTQVAGWSTYTFLLWIIKAAMCIFYLRLTDGLGFRKRVYTGFVLIATTWIAVLLAILLGCYPLSKNWQIYPDPGNSCQPAISKVDILVTVVLNVLTDIYLMSIPIPMLWHSSLRPFKKAGLILLFSGGAFVTVAGVLRCVLIITDPINGAEKAGSWAVRETFVAVVTSNLPMISPLITRLFRPLIGSLRSLSSTQNKASGGLSRSLDAKPRAVIVLEDKNPRRGMGPRSVHPIPNFTANDSEEQICVSHHHHHDDDDDGSRTHTRDAHTPTSLNRGVDLEAGRVAPSLNGVILKQTSVEVVETRKSLAGPSPDGRDVGDYYLVTESRRLGDGPGPRKMERRPKRASVGFGLFSRS